MAKELILGHGFSRPLSQDEQKDHINVLMGGRRSGKQLAEVSAILKAGEERIRKDERDKILKELARLMDCSERKPKHRKMVAINRKYLERKPMSWRVSSKE